jgi:hypothetical protein
MSPVRTYFSRLIYTENTQAMPTSAETIALARSVPFAEKSGAKPEHKIECHLDTRLPEYIAAAVRSETQIVISANPPDDVTDKVLKLELVRISERAGGIGYKRPARVAVRGELVGDNELIGSFIVVRQTLKTAKFDGFKGACASLGRSLEVLSRDIAKWLANPTLDAKLGDA